MDPPGTIRGRSCPASEHLRKKSTPPSEINQDNFKTCSDILVILDDTSLQRNVGLASLGRAPQQRKMQNAKGLRKKNSPHHVAKYFVSLWHCMFYQSWMFRESMTGFMIGFCKIMIGRLILINKPPGGWSLF